MTTIAVMQPYFFPYLGYYRLFAAVDLFVIYDCVQFPRRSYVHRNRLPDNAGRPEWLTLPLARAPVDIRIDQLRFAADAAEEWPRRLERFPSWRMPTRPEFQALAPTVGDLGNDPPAYLERTLRQTIAGLGVDRPMILSSSLKLAPDLRGQQRILEICRHLRARRYVNAPGGRALYEPEAFSRAGVELTFLPPWSGGADSTLHRLATEPWSDLAREVAQTAIPQP